MFEQCHTCHTSEKVTLVENWQRLVIDEEMSIPIIGCGNPWHYTGLYRRNKYGGFNLFRRALGRLSIPNQKR